MPQCCKESRRLVQGGERGYENITSERPTEQSKWGRVAPLSVC